ncbi:MAG: SDR family oxidoreductase, partial [Pseudomonadota bacterium]
YHSGDDRAREVTSAVKALGVEGQAIAMDITDPKDIEFGVEAAARPFGGLDILVNNAATTRRPDGDDGTLSAITADYWDAMSSANLRGPFLTARAAEPYLRASDRGRIVNIGSTIGQGSHGAALPFSVTKAGIAPLTRFLAVRLAPDILVNCVAPGLMLGTGLTQHATEEFADTWRAAAITGKTTSIEDVACQVVGCCATTTMTGQVITIDGGIHLTP